MDIDLTYLPLKPRRESLEEISDGLHTMGESISAMNPALLIGERKSRGQVTRLTVASLNATIRIEANTTFRGCVYPAETRSLTTRAQSRFGVYVRVRMLAVADLYGGKLCAALDRQHPRDLFDVKLLLETDGLTPQIRRAFVVYLAGHNRPMSELLAPNPVNMSDLFHSHFRGMSDEDVSLDSLITVQRELPHRLVSTLDEDERAFLLALKQGQPEWDRLGIENLDLLPALQWKLQNIHRMSREKHRAAVEKLARVLQL